MSNYEATKYNFSGSSLTGAQGVNTGIIVPWTSTSVPSGFLECNGSNVSRSTYADLFAVVGTTYGSGDGGTTFGLPDLQNNVALGRSNNKALASTGGADTASTAGSVSVAGAAADHTLTSDEMAAHTHNQAYTGAGPYACGEGNQATITSTTSGAAGQSSAHGHNVTVNAGTYSGSATSVLQPYVTLLYLIKT